MKSLLGLSRALLTDVKRLHPGTKGLDRDLQSIEARVENEGNGFLSVALPAYGKALDQSLATGKMAYIPGFARNGEIPKLFSGILCHVFDTKTGILKDNASVECILTLRQLCYLFKKYLPNDTRKEVLEFRAEKDFKDTELSIRSVDKFRLDVFGRVCTLLLPQLDEFLEAECRHGPGAVLEKFSSNQKWSEVYNRLLDFDDRLLSVGYDLPASLLGKVPSERSPQCDLLGLCARVVFVPKSSSALRTITVEPCMNQFVQQGLNDVLRREIRNCAVMSNALALNSQVPNQVLALEGSRHGKWATVDLSSASDLLTTEVVCKAFEKRPRFLAALLQVRTPSVMLPNYGKLALQKFAGMGNATTFPVQSFVFAALAITSIVSERETLSLRLLRNAAKCVRVFGDDIIIRTEHFPRFADWINFFGLKINQGKTFSVGYFRESCGVDAFTGVDVTPVYLRCDPDVTSKDANALLSLVSTSNQLFMRCYYSTSDWLRTRVENVLGTLPLVSRTSQALGWHTRKDVRSNSKWNHYLHRHEIRAYVPIPLRKRDILDGMPALMKFFHMPRLAEYDLTHLEYSPHKFRINLRQRWVQG